MSEPVEVPVGTYVLNQTLTIPSGQTASEVLSSRLCEQELEFDLDFYVMCTQPLGHTSEHVGHLVSLTSVCATVTWPRIEHP